MGENKEEMNGKICSTGNQEQFFTFLDFDFRGIRTDLLVFY